MQIDRHRGKIVVTKYNYENVGCILLKKLQKPTFINRKK